MINKLPNSAWNISRRVVRGIKPKAIVNANDHKAVGTSDGGSRGKINLKVRFLIIIV